MGMGHRQRLTGMEQDALTGWRRVMFWRPGERARIKRGARRRERREAKRAIREEDN
jgi:hypothetical protein